MSEAPASGSAASLRPTAGTNPPVPARPVRSRSVDCSGCSAKAIRGGPLSWPVDGVDNVSGNTTARKLPEGFGRVRQGAGLGFDWVRGRNAATKNTPESAACLEP